MRAVVLGAAVVAAAVLAAAPAAADPPAEPPVDPIPPPVIVPASPPPPALTDPTQLLGPLDQLAPVGLLDTTTYRMPDGDQPSPYALTQGVPPGPFAFINGVKGTHAMVHGALGRMPGEDLGVALPGTAPPPGTALPPGLEEFLPDAAAPVVPPPPG